MFYVTSGCRQTTKMADLPGIISLLVLLYICLADSQELTPLQCEHLGMYNSLLCSSCNELDKFQLTPLKDSCSKCCQMDQEGEKALKMYPYAELIVCG
ncbi:Hypothetical predicted protein [Octopus vulgaris]|uniref:Selenoprotein F n=2 Tax=Octopus TaxID=6643 RepID=A0AA36AKD6_OCTVU|nr:Hypothetical predicted protein [Octopus vulgaris]